MTDEHVDLLTDNSLKEDLQILLDNINLQIEEVEKKALEMDIPVFRLETTTGDWPMRSLLVAKASTTHALVMMQMMEREANVYINNYHYAEGVQA